MLSNDDGVDEEGTEDISEVVEPEVSIVTSTTVIKESPTLERTPTIEITSQSNNRQENGIIIGATVASYCFSSLNHNIDCYIDSTLYIKTKLSSCKDSNLS